MPAHSQKVKAAPVGTRAVMPVFPRLRVPVWLAALALVLGTVLAYQPAWHAGFIWDDDVYVTQNALLTAPDGLWRIWFSLDSPSQYFPLTYTVFRFEHLFWGQAAAGYHCLNILLHALNALLVWRLWHRLGAPGPWLVAAIFALHPVQVESVAWVTELKNVLSLFFILLALLAWLEFIHEEAKPAWGFYLGALFCQALALAAKSTACTLPAALFLMLWLKHQPIRLARLAQLLPFLALSAAMGLLAMWWERFHQGTQGKLFALGLPERVLVASHAIWFYLGKLCWPVHLTFSYPAWTLHPSDPLAYGWLAAGAGAVALIYFFRRSAGRSLEVSALFYVLTLSPLLGFIMLYTFRFTFVADHYQYVACLGPIGLMVAALHRAGLTWGWGRPFLKPALGGVLLLILGILTWRQCQTYADAETLWRTTIDRNPASWLARVNLGNILFDQGRNAEGMIQFQQALRDGPDSPEAQNDVGFALLGQGQAAEAASCFQEAIRLSPDFTEAQINLGVSLLNQGRTAEAITQYQEVLRLHPNCAEAHYNLGIARFNQGRTDQATLEFREAVRLRPDYAEAFNNLGAALLQQKQTEEAIHQLQTALALKPDYDDARRNLATARQMQAHPAAPQTP